MIIADINYKKLGLIAIFLVVVVVIGYFIYSLFFKPTINTQTEPGNEATGGLSGLPEAGSGTQTPITGDNGQLPDIQSPGGQTGQDPNETTNEDRSTELGVTATDSRLTSGGRLQFYNQTDGKFYQLDADGKPVALSDKKFAGVENIVWSPANNKAILEFPDGSKIRYNFDTQEQVTLPKHWQDFDFSPTGDKIVAKSIGIDPNNRWLIVSNDDGSKAQKIEDLGENGDAVISSWSPNNQTIAMYVEGVDFNRKEVYFIGQNGENFKSMVVEGRDFRPLWSPKGEELLYSVYSADNNYNPTLWLASAQGDSIGANRRPVGLNTWADKCSFTTGSIYCAVPETLERGAGLFPATANNTPDRLYRINPQTGLKQEINLGSASYTMKNLYVSPDGQYLYFTDARTGNLRKIKLN